MNIKLEYMRQFLAVSKHNSLSEAAQALNRSPSAVSMTLKIIEDQLGEKLFEGERKQKLTPFGLYFHECSNRVVFEHQKAIENIQQFAKGESGLVKVSTVPSVATHLLPLVITQLYKKFPDIQVDLRDIDSSAVARMILEGASDIGIASLSSHSAHLKTELLTEEPFVCVFPKNHPLSKGQQKLSWDELAEYPFIANTLLDQINNSDLHKLTTSAHLRIRNIASLTAFVEEGFGITLLPRMATYLTPKLSSKPLQDDSVKRQLYLLLSADRSIPSAAQSFIDEIHCQVLKLN